MVKKSIFKYIKKNIDDKYILDAMYFCLRNIIQMTIFNGTNISYFKISKKYVSEEVQLPFYPSEHKASDVLGILLSLRAIMLDSQNLDYCYDDRLIFCRYGKKEFGWLDYANLINMYNKDEEFHLILRILADLVDNKDILPEDKEKFIAQTKSPECRNILNYYRDKLLDPDADKSDMIPNCAHVCDDGIEDFVISKEIGYIGDTAFAYCNRLSSIEFQSPKVLFGKFPILECQSLDRIVVPEGSKEYYCEQLPYYKNIIVDAKQTHDQEGNSDSNPDLITEKDPEKPITENVVVEEPTKRNLLGRLSGFVKEKLRHKVDDSKNDEARIALIKQSFSKKVTTYKYFWFLSLLRHIKNAGTYEAISVESLTRGMVANAWKYVLDYKGDFPSGDQLPELVRDIKGRKRKKLETLDVIHVFIIGVISTDSSIATKIAKLANNAPYRFLSPWITFTTMSDVVNSSSEFKNDCPYSISKKEVEINPNWHGFFSRNTDSLIDYIENELLNVLNIELAESKENNEEEEWRFVDSVYFEKASKVFFEHKCRVVMSDMGYFLEVDDEYIKLGDYPEIMGMLDGSIWIKRPKIGTSDLRIVHVDGVNKHNIGSIREDDDRLTFTTPDGEEKIITFS